MKTSQYIKELRKNLADLSSNKRDEILQEIESFIDESGANYDQIISKFGTPDELASSYLEGVEKKISIFEKVSSFGGKIFAVISIVFILIVIGIVYLINSYDNDPFDYSKYTAKTIQMQIDDKWSEISNIKTIDMWQSKVTFYWSDNDKLKYSCKGVKPTMTDDTLVIKKSLCFILMPKQQINFKANQSIITLVEPKYRVNFDIFQSILRIAQKSSYYRYNIFDTQSDIDNIKSNENGILIEGKALQSTIQQYKF